MFQSIRYSLRMMLKHKVFTAVAVLTLALGIGATTALFSVVYGVLINPYPYANADRIWTPGVRTVKENQRMRPFPMTTFEDMSKLPRILGRNGHSARLRAADRRLRSRDIRGHTRVS